MAITKIVGRTPVTKIVGRTPVTQGVIPDLIRDPLVYLRVIEGIAGQASNDEIAVLTIC